MKKLIAGNWKMNGTRESARNLVTAIADSTLKEPVLAGHCDLLICPPFVHLEAVLDVIRGKGVALALGAQDCVAVDEGAYTGDITAHMLKDIGCNYVILGHSERRQYHNEKDEQVAVKAEKAHDRGLITIICVGEKEAERDGGYETEVVDRQIEHSLPPSATALNTLIAYEPVWAIGTGKTATPEDVRVMHQFIREKLQERLEDSASMRILYGGSMKPDNAQALLAVPNVDGGLIGGASLKAEDFLNIARAA